MKARRLRSEQRAERRRNLAEMNLMTEQKTKQTTDRRGCVIPFLGLLALALASSLAMWFR